MNTKKASLSAVVMWRLVLVKLSELEDQVEDEWYMCDNIVAH